MHGTFVEQSNDIWDLTIHSAHVILWSWDSTEILFLKSFHLFHFEFGQKPKMGNSNVTWVDAKITWFSSKIEKKIKIWIKILESVCYVVGLSLALVRILFFMLYFEAAMFMAVIALGCLVCNNNTWASKIPSNVFKKGIGNNFEKWTSLFVILSTTSSCGHEVWKSQKLSKSVTRIICHTWGCPSFI